MNVLKYIVIKSEDQYQDYCNILEGLLSIEAPNNNIQNEIDLLTLLIESYEDSNNSLTELEPIPLLKELMTEHQLTATELAGILGVSKGLVSDILHLRKNLSKEVIRKLSEHFHLRQEAFNRLYALQTPYHSINKAGSQKASSKNVSKASHTKPTSSAKQYIRKVTT